MGSGIGSFGWYALACAALTVVGCGKTSRDDNPAAGEAGGSGSAGKASAGGHGAATPGGAGGAAGGGTTSAGAGGSVSAGATAVWDWTVCGSIEAVKPAVAAAFAPKGDDLVVAYDDGSILLYDESSRAAKRVLRESGTQVDGFVLSVDGQYLAAGGNRFIEVTRWADGVQLPDIDLQDCPTDQVRFSAESDQLLAWNWQFSELCIWRVADGALLHRVPGSFYSAGLAGNRLLVAEVGTPSVVKAITLPDRAAVTVSAELGPLESRGFYVSPRGDTFVSFLTDSFGPRSSKLWSSEGLFIAEASHLIFSPDGARVAVGDQILDSRTGERVGTFSPSDLSDSTATTAINSDFSRVVSIWLYGGGGTGSMEVWELATGERLRLQAAGDKSEPLKGLAISPDGRQLAVGTDIVVLWSIAADFADSQQLALERGFALQDIEFSPSSELLVSGLSPTIYLPEATRLVDRGFPESDNGLGACDFTALRASPANRWVAVGQGSGDLRVRERVSNERVATLLTPGCNTRAAFSSDERYLATTEAALYRTSDWARVWAAPRTKPLRVSFGEPEEDLYQDVAFLAGDTQLLVSYCGGKPGPDTCSYTLHSVADGSVIRELPQLGAHHASVSAESHWVAAGKVLLHLPTDTVRTLDPAPALAVFTPEGDIIGASDDGTLTRYCRTR